MYLASLKAINFKNYMDVSMDFCNGLNLFTGPNGSGKTNLLDAIYFLCLTKSAFHSNDSLNIKHNESLFSLKGKFTHDEKTFVIHSALQKGQKKVVSCNKKQYEKISDHIGNFPAVLITPYDNDLIREGSEERRKFFDSILSQTNPEYLADLLKFNRLLKQRNALLKSFAEQKKQDLELLKVYDEQLLPISEIISAQRLKLLDSFLPVFQDNYNKISVGKEKVGLIYESDSLKEDFRSIYKASLKKDLAIQRTSIGAHKDDFNFLLEEHSLKSFGSQGQQKSYVISLKLAQFDYIKQKSGKRPILLLDDIFDKLDQERIEKLIELVRGELYGQVFITDARADRVDNFFKEYSGEIRKFNILDGKVSS